MSIECVCCATRTCLLFNPLVGKCLGIMAAKPQAVDEHHRQKVVHQVKK